MKKYQRIKFEDMTENEIEIVRFIIKYLDKAYVKIQLEYIVNNKLTENELPSYIQRN